MTTWQDRRGRITKYEKCPECGGTSYRKCPKCGGSGRLRRTSFLSIEGSPVDSREDEVICDACVGRGTEKCPNCVDGTITRTELAPLDFTSKESASSSSSAGYGGSSYSSYSSSGSSSYSGGKSSFSGGAKSFSSAGYTSSNYTSSSNDSPEMRAAKACGYSSPSKVPTRMKKQYNNLVKTYREQDRKIEKLNSALESRNSSNSKTTSSANSASSSGSSKGSDVAIMVEFVIGAIIGFAIFKHWLATVIGGILVVAILMPKK